MTLVKFDDLPLGARFRYPGLEGDFVKLDTYGYDIVRTGLVADCRDGGGFRQGLYSAADTEGARAALEVEPVSGDFAGVLPILLPYLSHRPDCDQAHAALNGYSVKGGCTCGLFDAMQRVRT